MQPGSDREVAGMGRISRVVKAGNGAGGEKVGQARDRLHHVAAGLLQYALLLGAVGRLGGGHFRGRGIKERRLVGEEFERQRGVRLNRQTCGHAAQGHTG